MERKSLPEGDFVRDTGRRLGGDSAAMGLPGAVTDVTSLFFFCLQPRYAFGSENPDVAPSCSLKPDVVTRRCESGPDANNAPRGRSCVCAVGIGTFAKSAAGFVKRPSCLSEIPVAAPGV